MISHMKRTLIKIKRGALGKNPFKTVLTVIWEKAYKQKLTTPLKAIHLSQQSLKGPVIVAEENITHVKQLKRSFGLNQEGPSEGLAEGSSSKKIIIAISSNTSALNPVVQPSVNVAEPNEEVVALALEVSARDKHIKEVLESLRKSREETKLILSSNTHLSKAVKEKIMEIEALTRNDWSQSTQFKEKEEEIWRLSSHLEGIKLTVKGQSDKIFHLTSENESKTSLIAEKEQALQAEIAAQAGTINQIRAKDAEEALKRQQIALSGLQDQLAAAQAKVQQAPVMVSTSCATEPRLPEDTRRLNRLKAQLWERERSVPWS